MPVATEPDRLARRLTVVSVAAGVERDRLLHWILAWTSLSAAWFLGEGVSPVINLHLAELAVAELAR